jgi:hypothetical protein
VDDRVSVMVLCSCFVERTPQPAVVTPPPLLLLANARPLTSLQRTLNRLLQRLLGLIQLLLDLHNTVPIVRVLELLDIPPQMSLRHAILVGLQAGLVGPRRFGELAGELVEDLAEQLVRNELVVVLVGDDDSRAPFAAGVDVDGELVFGFGLAGAGAGGFGDGAVDFTADFADAGGGGGGVSGVVGEGWYGGCWWWD